MSHKDGDTDQTVEVHCTCKASCEPHIHEGNEVLCLHDGEEDHSHCVNNTWRKQEQH